MRKHKQLKEMNQTVYDLKMEIEPIKKIQTEKNLEMRNLGTKTGIPEARLTNRIEWKKESQTLTRW